MGKTSANTACKPRFLRLEGDVSACKKSRYELVCNSMRFGGAMISLILPKFIRSLARDGILTFNHWLAKRQPLFVFKKRHKASPRSSTANLPQSKPPVVDS